MKRGLLVSGTSEKMLESLSVRIKSVFEGRKFPQTISLKSRHYTASSTTTLSRSAWFASYERQLSYSSSTNRVRDIVSSSAEPLSVVSGECESGVSGSGSSNRGIEVLREDKDLFKKYRLFRDVIGQGAYGKVYKGLSVENGQPVAVKVIGKEHKKYKSHLEREVAFLERVRGHRSCVQLLDAFETINGNKAYLVTELLEGGDLFEYIAENNIYLGNMTTKTALHLTKSMLQALEVCHMQNFAHLDCKPENFVYRNKYTDLEISSGAAELVLVDFGSAQEFRLRPFAREKAKYEVGMDEFWIGEAEDKIGGTASYLSPEVVIESRFSSRSDVWSMGVTLYMLLTGQRPFDFDKIIDKKATAEAEEVIQSKIRNDATGTRELSVFYTCPDVKNVNNEQVRQLLLDMTNPNPAERPSSTEAISIVDKIIALL